MPDNVQSKPAAEKFNTFSGVFVPSVLAILGAVMYLIAPKVLGGVGLVKMFGILFIAHAITLATAFSIAAIVTNIKVKEGGLYFLISRSLGREFGGSMGIQLYLAQTIGTAFYTIACATAVQIVLSSLGYRFDPVSLTLGLYLIFFLITYRGAGFVIRIQYIILAIILISIVTILLAPNLSSNEAHLTGNQGIKIPFWIAFALFFPAVTGIDAGVGMSGDLKNPTRSLVKGTFLAIMFTMLIYFLLAVKLSYATTPMELSTDSLIAVNVAPFPFIILIGILVATVSSALSYLMTSPRTLRAMVEDDLFPDKVSFLGNPIGNSKEPRVALILSFLIGSGFIIFGDLDLVSKIVAMFFLNVYGWINGAAFFEAISRNPSYRPTFDAPVAVSFFGMLSCYIVMYLFNPWVMIFGILFQLLIFYLLTKHKPSVKYESVWEGVRFQILRNVLKRIEEGEKSKKNWRPTILSFAVNQRNHMQMFSLLDWISSNRGYMKMYSLMKGDVSLNAHKRQELQLRMKEYVKDYDLELFPRVLLVDNYEKAIETVIQSETLGNLPLNTLLIDYDDKLNLMRLSNIAQEQEKNFLILRNEKGVSDLRRIDVWWSSPRNGNLSILLAYLITQSKQWRKKDPVIRIFSIVEDKKDVAPAREKIVKIITESRMDNVEINVYDHPKKQIAQEIFEVSCYSDLVIIGLHRNKNGKVDRNCITRIKEYTARLTVSLIVSAHDDIDFSVN